MVHEPDAGPIVFVIDDDQSVRNSLSSLFQSVDLQVEAFRTPSEFLTKSRPDVVSCLVLDVRLPGLSGLDFQNELAAANITIPIIFITGHGDIPMTVKAMKAGAVEFLTKPFREQDLLDAVRVALERDRSQRRSEETASALRARFETLTARERQVFPLVTKGLLNKHIAVEIDVSEITVKIYRRSLMTKMGARTFAELVRMADALGDYVPTKSRPGINLLT
jgi:FixJ family two-component response regulator